MNCNELFRFDKTDDHCTIAEYLAKENSLITSAEIPGTYNGKPVTEIREGAFAEAKYLERVKFPDSVKVIEYRAFYGCSGLRDIVWGSGLTDIDWLAFERCTAFERLVIPEGVQTIDEYAFAECGSLREVILPHSLEYLNACAFRYCTELEKVVFLNKNIHIHNLAFADCPKLPAETILFSMTGGSYDTEAPFFWDYLSFDLNAALRKDIF